MGNERLDSICEAGVIAVVRAPTAQAAIDAADAVIRGGVTGIEVTFTVPDAIYVVEKLIARYGQNVQVGLGTITTPSQAEAATATGADFLVTPGCREDVVKSMVAAGRVTMAGALSPTEVMSANALGVDAVKLFPASLGGPSYLSALRGPFPDTDFVPTGGVTAENLSDWIGQGAIAVGAGGDLVSSESVRERDWSDIEARASRYSRAFRQTLSLE
ncbi:MULTISPECIES: bifunctional 4-hydroxy-2-oxoglutarate aldolase/2-dehydro-3-deoxy-phosphogluconate aldolase [unclassified Brevibacterium]|uniref:bifunctional 4-hydroxy-2-oxoglutarate aldolase/2-dehydro-3-deoxy-phosphogluconate aldolase n=1 Tax=unclassified Brevibacterium TaxID=2614124 RepID=UPI0018693BFE|nr:MULTISPECIES: bifunctional 4-hydroxy-2-oxoglutarate aldolase/2-dehydro-3-deoxy-phosphogluconate aldolase [unclassified Brevibacterium]